MARAWWHAERILSDLDQAEAEFVALSRGVTQTLHVGLLWGFSPPLLGLAVAAFHDKLPRWPVCIARRRGQRRTLAEDEFVRCLNAAAGSANGRRSATSSPASSGA